MARRLGEFALIDRYFRPLATDPGAFALTDDAALYRQRPGDDLVLTTDTVAAGVHFFPDDPADSIARKALRVNLSDLAAKGAEPFGYLLSLALPDTWTEAWLRRFAAGLEADQRVYGVSLLGGDTTRAAGGLSVTVTALGRVPKGNMVLRSGAEPGDSIFVSGTVGDGALGLRLRGRRGRGIQHLVDRYLHPQPRVALAPVVRAHATAAMDVSDGLIGDLAHICEQSGVGAEIFVPDIPLSPAAAAMLIDDAKLLPVILNGGDDYEILATIPRTAEGAFVEDADACGVSVTRIGTMTKKKGPPVVRDRNGKVLKLRGGSHVHF